MSVLVVAAHPDDEVLGAGGLIARLTRAGTPVTVAILGEGITSRYERREDADPSELAELHARARQANVALGVGDLRLFDFPDNRFDTVPLLEVIKTVEALVRELAPTAIYTHHLGDLNIDHQITARAVMTATRTTASCAVREVYMFEVPSSTEWAFMRHHPVFTPNVFYDVAESLDAKVAAIECYDSEVRDFPHPRSPAALRAIAQRWGTVVGRPAAEAFELVRAVR